MVTSTVSERVQLSQATMLVPEVTGQAGWTTPGSCPEAHTSRAPAPWYQPMR